MAPDNMSGGSHATPHDRMTSEPARRTSREGSPTAPEIDAQTLYDFVDAIADKIDQGDPVATGVESLIEEAIRSESLEIPRMPHVAAKILDYARSSEASTKDVIRNVRTDPVLAGKLIEMANSAAFAGSQPVFSLQGAVVRLGLNSVSETAMEMSGTHKNFAKEKRSNMLARLWKFSLATGFACEALADRVGGEKAESGFLTGIFHAVSAPAIVNAIGRLERQQKIPPQSDSRVLGLLEKLDVGLTDRIIRRWSLPKAAQEAIRLQNMKVRDRRGKPLAHILVCGKAIVKELGIGIRPEPIDFEVHRDFKFINMMEEERLEPIRETVQDKMLEVSRY